MGVASLLAFVPCHRYAVAYERDSLLTVGADPGCGGSRTVYPAISGLLMAGAVGGGFGRRFRAVACL
jgi:hypothetical protein